MAVLGAARTCCRRELHDVSSYRADLSAWTPPADDSCLLLSRREATMCGPRAARDVLAKTGPLLTPRSQVGLLPELPDSALKVSNLRAYEQFANRVSFWRVRHFRDTVSRFGCGSVRVCATFSVYQGTVEVAA